MNKKENDKIKRLLNSSANSYEDKLALLKYLMKKNSGTVTGAVSNILKKNNLLFFNHKYTISIMPITIFSLNQNLAVIKSCFNF